MKICCEYCAHYEEDYETNCRECTNEGRQDRWLFQLNDELTELERLAKIGEATEKAFEDGKYITDASSKTLSNSDDLIEWAVEND